MQLSKKLEYLIAFCLFFVGCATHDLQQQNLPEKEKTPLLVVEKEPPLSAPMPSASPFVKPTPAPEKKLVVGDPMGNALLTMNKAKEDMTETIQLVEEVRAGDKILDCKNERAATFEAIQQFFGKKYCAYDPYNFWFVTADGQKVSIFEDDGYLTQCKIGLFLSFKRLIATQELGAKKIQTEFFVDTTKGNLMVHRYRVQENTNENYVLSGY